MAAKVYKELSEVVIVDAAAFKALSNEEMLNVMLAIAKFVENKKEVKMITDLTPYISLRIIRVNVAKGTCLKEHLEYFLDKTITPDHLAIVNSYTDAQKALDQMFSVDPIDYPFMALPDGIEDGTENISLLKNTIKRGDYTMGYKTFDKLWGHCLAAWTKTPGAPTHVSIQAAGRTNNTYIRDNRVEVGCQTIQRYEVEQVAVKLGLSFTVN